MVEAKTIGISALLIALIGTSGTLLYQNIDFGKDNYYCASRGDIWPKQCDSLVKYGVDNGKCIIGSTGYICKEGWIKITKDEAINLEKQSLNTQVVSYSCNTESCDVI